MASRFCPRANVGTFWLRPASDCSGNCSWTEYCRSIGQPPAYIRRSRRKDDLKGCQAALWIFKSPPSLNRMGPQSARETSMISLRRGSTSSIRGASRSVEARRRTEGFTRGKLEIQPAKWLEQCVDGAAQPLRVHLWAVQRRPQDFTNFLLHGSAVFGGSDPESSLQRLVQISNGDARHAGTPLESLMNDASLIAPYMALRHHPEAVGHPFVVASGLVC